MRLSYLFLMWTFSAFTCMSGTAQMNPNLTADEFERAINKDSIQLLDVRTPGEYTTGHIKNTLLADWNDEKEFYRRIAFIDKQIPVYVYCLGGGRSAAAAAKMRTMGYQQVFELTGGINAWKAADKRIEGISGNKQMSLDELSKAINSAKIVLVDVGAEWCPPCKKMEPVLKNLQSNYPNHFTIVKVDGGRDQDILKKYQVTALPVFILFREGKQVWRKDGVFTEQEIAALLN